MIKARKANPKDPLAGGPLTREQVDQVERLIADNGDDNPLLAALKIARPDLPQSQARKLVREAVRKASVAPRRSVRQLPPEVAEARAAILGLLYGEPLDGPLSYVDRDGSRVRIRGDEPSLHLDRTATADRGGRPPGLTNIQSDDVLIAAVREMRIGRRRISMQTLAANAGYTVADIRGYLRVTKRAWREFLNSI
jgi:hypothetical protein